MTWKQPSQPERWIHTTAGDVPLIDSKDLDAIVAVEVFRDECDAGLITRTMQDRFPFVKVP